MSYSLFVSVQNLVIFKSISLYHILYEIGHDLNFRIIFIDSEHSLKDKAKNLNNYLVISNKKYLNFSNQLIIGETPISIFKLVENINIEFLKMQFNSQSEFKLNSYIINLNSREMQKENNKLKLTEKEINTIIYLSKLNKPISVEELQQKVWGYQFDVETHTVETHIYRLRKKILKTFDDNKFIISKKNGYQIK